MAKSTISLGILILQAILLICTVEAQDKIWKSMQKPNCRTPDNLKGVCIPIRQCEPMLNILIQRQLTQDHRQFLKDAQCGVGWNKYDPKVCCPILTVLKDHSNLAMNRQNLSWPVNSNPYLPKNCGSDLSKRIIGGEKTDLTEFPWMVLLEYTKPNGIVTACGGVLISNRYVLTAAHCLHGKNLMKSWKLNAVRLGEYDTSTKQDCLPDGEDTVICADDPVTVKVEEQILHESYQPYSRNQRHDIALIRLSKSVRFTNYIKPICLPTSSTLPHQLSVAGWGQTEYASESNVKLKLTISPADPATCTQRYKTVGIDLGTSQLCAGGERGKDSCHGDSGGPLMLNEKRFDGKMKWAVVGVVSFGPNPCGMRYWPGIYTRVTDYVPWILSKLRP